jgi:hypothetical protein
MKLEYIIYILALFLCIFYANKYKDDYRVYFGEIYCDSSEDFSL